LHRNANLISKGCIEMKDQVWMSLMRMWKM